MQPQEVLLIADRVAVDYGSAGALLIVTAAWTGARWSELAALRRPNLHLYDDTGFLRVDPNDGALYEWGSMVWLGPLKTPESARSITLPPFLAQLLRAHLAHDDHPHVFVSPERAVHRRAAFRRRALRRVTGWSSATEQTRVSSSPIKPGPTFHEFRRSHRAWLMEDGASSLVWSRRLGDKVRPTSRLTAVSTASDLDADPFNGLESRWNHAVETSPASDRCGWRHVDRW